MSDTAIHPTAIISPTADLGAGCRVGPYCVVGENAVLGDRCVLHSHVVLDGHLTIGADCEFFPFSCIGKKTQDLKYKGDISYVSIGDRNVFREYTTVHMATSGGGKTEVGNDCLIQAYCHIAHECILGNKIIMSSGSMLAGHVDVGDCAVIGGLAGIVQFVRIGTMAMVGGYSKLTHDVLPFCIADGIPAQLRIVNKIGMERNGKSPDQIKIVTQAFRKLMLSRLPLKAASSELADEFPDSDEVKAMLAFIDSSDRGLARAKEK